MSSDVETLRDDVRVKDIFVDWSYGRPLRHANVEKLMRNWDRQRIGAVYLSLREDGTFACLDGWHRVCACRAVEGEMATVPARVYIDLTPTEEAELFSAFNKDRAALTPGELFRSRLSANERQAHEIYDIVKSIDLDISFDGASGKRVIQGVATLDKIYEQYGPDMLREVYLTMAGTLGDDSGSLSSAVAKGLAAFLVRYGEQADRKRVHDILSTSSVPRLKMLASQMKAVTPSIDVVTGIGMGLLQLYNTGLRSNHLPPWQMKVYSPIVIDKVRARSTKNIQEWNAKRASEVSA